jgi:hypothetical protein
MPFVGREESNKGMRHANCGMLDIDQNRFAFLSARENESVGPLAALAQPSRIELTEFEDESDHRRGSL